MYVLVFVIEGFDTDVIFMLQVWILMSSNS